MSYQPNAPGGAAPGTGARDRRTRQAPGTGARDRRTGQANGRQPQRVPRRTWHRCNARATIAS